MTNQQEISEKSRLLFSEIYKLYKQGLETGAFDSEDIPFLEKSFGNLSKLLGYGELRHGLPTTPEEQKRYFSEALFKESESIIKNLHYYGSELSKNDIQGNKELLFRENIWPPIDYDYLKKAGVSPGIAYLINYIRFFMPKNPSIYYELQDVYRKVWLLIRATITPMLKVKDNERELYTFIKNAYYKYTYPDAELKILVYREGLYKDLLTAILGDIGEYISNSKKWEALIKKAQIRESNNDWSWLDKNANKFVEN